MLPHAALGVSARLLLDLADDLRRLVTRLRLDLLEQDLLGLALRQAGDPLELAQMLLPRLPELLRQMLGVSLTVVQRPLAPRDLLEPGLEDDSFCRIRSSRRTISARRSASSGPGPDELWFSLGLRLAIELQEWRRAAARLFAPLSRAWPRASQAMAPATHAATAAVMTISIL